MVKWLKPIVLRSMGIPPEDTLMWGTAVPRERLFEMWSVGVTSYQRHGGGGLNILKSCEKALP